MGTSRGSGGSKPVHRRFAESVAEDAAEQLEVDPLSWMTCVFVASLHS